MRTNRLDAKLFALISAINLQQITNPKGLLFAGAGSDTTHGGGKLRRTADLMRFSTVGANIFRKQLARFQCLGT